MNLKIPNKKTLEEKSCYVSLLRSLKTARVILQCHCLLHGALRHNTVWQLISVELLSIDYVKSKDNLMDPLTKTLNKDQVYIMSRK